LKKSKHLHSEHPAETERWFDLNELCTYIPDKPSKPTVYGWVNAGSIPVHKGGKKLRFLKSEIDSWLKQGRRKTLAEITSEAEANQWQVRMELQADCYAGIWAHHAERSRQILENGDVDEALGAAAASACGAATARGRTGEAAACCSHGEHGSRRLSSVDGRCRRDQEPSPCSRPVSCTAPPAS
jgi:excisionase family DNA binding protein